MVLMEDLASTPLNQPVIVQQVQNSSNSYGSAPPPPPSNIISGPLPKRSFKGSLLKLELLLDVKTRLLNRRKYRETDSGELVITDEYYLDEQEQEQFKEEIKKIQEQIDKLTELKADIEQLKDD